MKKETNEVQTGNITTSEVAVVENSSNFQVQTVNINGQLPDLSKAVELPIDLMSDYWTPEKPGESKRVVFVKMDNSPVLDQNSGEIMDLECAFFLSQEPTEIKMIRNGSKRLIGAIQSNQVKQGTPLLITYKGKKKNRTNGFSSDDWSIRPLLINLNAN